ncbi:MAG: hypothetical protein L0Y74_11210 [candidate division Zixibacteria bacterium]|nr:hypothetical protein [candidate division Zixibacteria bacterium]
MSNFHGLSKITPEEMAEVFWSFYYSEEQTRFFNRLAEVADSADFVKQLRYITVNNTLTTAARARMKAIGAYSQCR